MYYESYYGAAHLGTGNQLQHHGVKGMKWGVRRYQNKDGTLTSAGKTRHTKTASRSNNNLTDVCSSIVNRNADMTMEQLYQVQADVEELLKTRRKREHFVLSRELHYARNEINKNLPVTAKDAENANWHKIIANAHQFTSKSSTENIKYVDPTGKFEAVYNNAGQLITNPLDMGSYNFSPSDISKLRHAKDDVLPWLIYGNTPDDPSTIRQRSAAILGLYTKKMRDL